MKKSTLLFLTALIISLQASAQYKWCSFQDTLNYSIRTMLSDTSTSFYIGGTFSKLGALNVKGIAKWNGTNWAQIAGSGIIGNEVMTMTHYNGGIVAAGTFTSINAVNCNNIAYYNGTSWSPMGGGLDYTGGITVSTLTVFEDDLYAGGTFVTSAGDTMNNVAQWNGSDWVSLGSGINGTVASLCVYNDKLYAGGTFTSAGGVAVNNIAVWDGLTWGNVGTGVSYTGGITVSTMTVFNNELYIGGNFQIVNGDSIDNVAKWNDTTWTGLGAGMRYTGAITVSTLTLNPVDKYLIVSAEYQDIINSTIEYHLQSWDGTNWELIDSKTNSPVYAIADIEGALFIGGAFYGIADEPQVKYLAAYTYCPGKAYMMLTQAQNPEKQMFALYPNPVSDNLYMKLINEDEMSNDQFTFTLTNLLGTVVSSVTVTGSDLKFQRTGIPSGIYHYELMNVNKNIIQKGKVVFR
jgi:type IX secretion system substrate protein